MGREIKRVAAGFEWPLGEVWSGYEQWIDCEICKEYGEVEGVMNPTAKAGGLSFNLRADARQRTIGGMTYCFPPVLVPFAVTRGWLSQSPFLPSGRKPKRPKSFTQSRRLVRTATGYFSIVKQVHAQPFPPVEASCLLYLPIYSAQSVPSGRASRTIFKSFLKAWSSLRQEGYHSSPR